MQPTIIQVLCKGIEKVGEKSFYLIRFWFILNTGMKIHLESRKFRLCCELLILLFYLLYLYFKKHKLVCL